MGFTIYFKNSKYRFYRKIEYFLMKLLTKIRKLDIMLL